jgi:DUF1009 family protein
VSGALGVIAGGGDLPQRVATAARRSGTPVVIAALEGFAEDWTSDFDHVRAGLGELGKMIDYFKAQGVSDVTFCGVVKRPDFSALKVDWRGARALPQAIAAAAKGDDALLRVVVGVFESEGFAIAAPETFDDRLVAKEGRLGAVEPRAEHAQDIEKALDVAREIGRLDIGQGAVVCDGVVLAVEAQEGTDLMLARVAELPQAVRGAPTARRGVLAKLPKPIQERRIDLPTVGVATIAGVDKAGLAGVVVEAGGALIVDVDAVARAAEAAGVFVLVRSASVESA